MIQRTVCSRPTTSIIIIISSSTYARGVKLQSSRAGVLQYLDVPQVWCSRGTSRSCRTAALEDWSLTPLTYAVIAKQHALLRVRFPRSCHLHTPLTALSCLTQNLSTGLAVAGVIVIARSIRVITKFQAPSEIPVRFIEGNVSLRGKVRSITERGIEVEHVPIYLPIISPLLSKHRDASTSPLLVRLAGVELTPEGKTWLQKNLVPPQTVWLKLISREDNMLHCLVSQSRGLMWSYCMNEELLRLGLARSAPIAGLPPGSPLYWRLHKRLHRAEVKAEKKGQGLWKKEGLWERASKALKDNPLLRLMGRIFRRTRAE